MVFFRGPDSLIAAVEDFCPHRGAPLSLGYVENGELVCGYHGLTMGADGKTASMPGQRVQSFPCNKSYSTVERYGFVWVWPGAQDQANPSLIPTLDWAISEEWAYGGGLFHINCDYRLMIDNLMDLMHETYVHASSIGQKENGDSSKGPPMNRFIQGTSGSKHVAPRKLDDHITDTNPVRIVDDFVDDLDPVNLGSMVLFLVTLAGLLTILKSF